MPGPNRRSRRLKQATDLSSIGEFASVNPADGDILIFDINDGVYENGRDLTGDYSIAGTLTATDLLVIDDVTIQDALVVQGNTNLEAALSVLGTSTLNDPVIATDTVNVTGATTLSSTLDVAGLLTGAGFLFNGTGQITGDLTVDGTLTADFDYSNMGDVTVNTLTANDWITVVNGVSAGTLAASNGLSVGGGASILGSLSAGELNVDDIYRVNFLPDEVNTPPEDDRIEITISEPETSLLFRVADTTSTFAVPVYNTAMEFQPDGAVDLYHDGTKVIESDSLGIKLLNANPALRLSDAAGTTQLSILQNFAGDIYLDNDVAGGTFNLRLDKADTTRSTVITGDPDGAVVLYNAGSIAMFTTATGAAVRDTSGSVPILSLQTDAGTTLANLTHFSNAFRIASTVHGDNMILTAENAAGTAKNLILGDPDGAVSLYYAGAVALKTHSTGFYVGTSTTVGSFIGSGTPESAVTAGIGSTFHRTDGGASTSFYVKESGTGNTGWVAK